MRKPSDTDPGELRRRVLGLGESSGRKSHYPSLRLRLAELERFRSAIDLAADLLFVLDLPSRRIVHVNEAACELLGRLREELVGSAIDGVLSAGSAEQLRRLFAQHEGGGPDRGMLVGELGGGDGGGTLVEMTVRCGRSVEDRYAVVAARNITERLRAEEEQRRLEDRLRHAQKMEALGQLAGGVAHDFNNLLTVISGYGELLVAELDEDDSRRTGAMQIVRAGTQAAALTRQLLAFGRRQLLQPTLVDLNALVTDTSQMLRRTIGEHIELQTRLDAGAGRIHADAAQMQQVLLNLAINARDAMPSGGLLVIQTCAVHIDQREAATRPEMTAGPYARLTVSDNGIGMDEATRSRAFEPFFTTKEPGHGTGLGLATVYGIVRQSGGQVTLTSETGQGTMIEILLPRLSGEPRADAEVEARELLPRGSETILVAEDQPEVRGLTLSILRRLGYATLESASGDEALRAASAFPGRIHLLLTDLVMPGISGVELADRLRARRPDTRVLFMSGYADRGVLELALAQDATALLQKPFSPRTLATRIRSALDR